MLEIKALEVKVGDKEILKEVSLNIKKNEIHALMGENGSGKSTLALTLMGCPNFIVTKGTVCFNNENILNLSVFERSLRGIFLSFQYPSEVSGVSYTSYLRTIYNKSRNEKVSPTVFRKILEEKCEILKINKELLSRSLNEGFSGGEKKKMEILQMLLLEPTFIILDEVDSGVDVDSLKYICDAVIYLKKMCGSSFLIITHHPRILNYLAPDFVHIVKSGKIVKSGDKKLIETIEKKGFKVYE